MLVAASNPCPCGRGEQSGECDCQPASMRRYRAKLSGALADRIDIAITVERPSAEEMGAAPSSDSASVRERVIAARERQERRLGPGAAMRRWPCGAARTLRDDRPRGDGRCSPPGHAELGLSGRGARQGVAASAPHDRGPRDGSARGESRHDHVARALTLRRRASSERRARRLTLGDPPGRAGYPAALLDLGAGAPDAALRLRRPAVIEGLEPGHTVTIVGSRRASSYGLGVAEELARLLAAAGLVVVSGMAAGSTPRPIAARSRGRRHRGGAGGGADVVYPASERGLYRRDPRERAR